MINKIKTERDELIHDKKVFRVIDKDNKNIILKKNLDLLKFFRYKIIE